METDTHKPPVTTTVPSETVGTYRHSGAIPNIVPTSKQVLRDLASMNHAVRCAALNRLASLSDDEFTRLTQDCRRLSQIMRQRFAVYQVSFFVGIWTILLLLSHFYKDDTPADTAGFFLLVALVVGMIVGGCWFEARNSAYRRLLAEVDKHGSKLSASVMLMRLEDTTGSHTRPSNKAIYEALLQLTPEMEESLGAADRATLANLLADPYSYVPLTLHIINLLKRIGATECVSAISLLCAEPLATVNMRAVRAAARECYPVVKARADRLAAGSDLLRASAAHITSGNELVRPAASTQTASEELLRCATQEQF